jgi:N-methylhydantoinase B
VIWSAAGGYGDPFEREPERVREDVAEGRAVSREAAREIYGVIVRDDGSLDLEGTTRERAERRAARVRKDPSVRKAAGKAISRVTENLEVRKENGSFNWACTRCAADLGPIRHSYKEHCVKEEGDIRIANPNIGDWTRYIDDQPVFRQFYCPGCGALVENEIARSDDPVLRDIELHLK